MKNDIDHLNELYERLYEELGFNGTYRISLDSEEDIENYENRLREWREKYPDENYKRAESKPDTILSSEKLEVVFDLRNYDI